SGSGGVVWWSRGGAQGFRWWWLFLPLAWCMRTDDVGPLSAPECEPKEGYFDFGGGEELRCCCDVVAVLDLAPPGSGLGDDSWCCGEVVVVDGGDEVAVDAVCRVVL
ncbi:hypothetical protein A2U01_0047083, partial [Trifolium medium]|nr:hypothetical protein [Trifolium medium]